MDASLVRRFWMYLCPCMLTLEIAIAPKYRLSPQYPFPCALQDLLTPCACDGASEPCHTWPTYCAQTSSSSSLHHKPRAALLNPATSPSLRQYACVHTPFLLNRVILDAAHVIPMMFIATNPACYRATIALQKYKPPLLLQTSDLTAGETVLSPVALLPAAEDDPPRSAPPSAPTKPTRFSRMTSFRRGSSLFS
jgi:hypothetical protein